MDHNQNPIHTKGDRNIFCPYYRNCLDYAVELRWKYWACLDCQHKKRGDFLTDVLLLPMDTGPYYSLSPSVYKKATHNSV